MSEHWHAAQIGILVAYAYFMNKEGAYNEHTVYVMTDGKEQSAAITQAAVNQVRSSGAPQPCDSIGAWHRGSACRCGGAMGLQLTSGAGMIRGRGGEAVVEG
ncbi:hypothetical protein HaLaN_01418 [Haematococcus lacustris]|uniref:Uncharacterized protein n=1 Tax=Haematococcus lacustris TaxID=44745 RepID=A0A699Y975_HAELA|nr:hypothetical protein HaLaN_01418 [Haematococcus lacustris]